jgi:formate-dependent nitrite reductase membrane component NrfD
LEWKSTSLVSLFLFLLSLNILDISLTNPSHEANPFTLYSWASIGILSSACMKVGLVLFFGVLCVVTRRLASPTEWNFASRLLQLLLIGLTAFYAFVVTWNMILLIS